MIEIKESNEAEKIQMAGENAVNRLPEHIEDSLRLCDKVTKWKTSNEKVINMWYHISQAYKLAKEIKTDLNPVTADYGQVIEKNVSPVNT